MPSRIRILLFYKMKPQTSLIPYTKRKSVAI